MKITYEAPIVEIKMLDAQDVLTSSNELPLAPGEDD